MIDYRPVIVQYIEDRAVIADGNVKDGTLSFKQPSTDYATYYVLSENIESFVNNTSQEVNGGDPTLLDTTSTPLTVVTLELDIRGPNSFTKSRNLYKSFDTINNKKTLADQGVYFMSVGAITSLPQLKNTRNEEGYIFDLSFSFDNSFIDTDTLADVVSVDGITT
jgi:hypothetical protein